MLEHGIHHVDRQLPHSSGRGHLGRFALAVQTLIKVADHRITTHRRDDRHVQHTPHLRAAPPVASRTVSVGGCSSRRSINPAMASPEC